MGLTTDPNDPDLGRGPDLGPGPQNVKYLVLSEEERDNGFVRPLRLSYMHMPCDTITTMHQEIAETWSRNISFYGYTYCYHCSQHLPVSEFLWIEQNGSIGPELGT